MALITFSKLSVWKHITGTCLWPSQFSMEPCHRYLMCPTVKESFFFFFSPSLKLWKTKGRRVVILFITSFPWLFQKYFPLHWFPDQSQFHSWWLDVRECPFWVTSHESLPGFYILKASQKVMTLSHILFDLAPQNDNQQKCKGSQLYPKPRPLPLIWSLRARAQCFHIVVTSNTGTWTFGFAAIHQVLHFSIRTFLAKWPAWL